MLNWLHARFYRPETGWDPVSPDHAAKYGAAEWQMVDESLLDELEDWVGGFRGKRVLDLGGGAGQYSVAFAKRGALVTWHDVSNTYRSIAEENAEKYSVLSNIYFSLGYIDEANKILSEKFDFIFIRLCWYYGWSDSSFARMVYDMIKEGGSCYIDCTNSAYGIQKSTLSNILRTWVNKYFFIKIGHPYPPRGRISELMSNFPFERMLVDYKSPLNDRILFKK